MLINLVCLICLFFIVSVSRSIFLFRLAFSCSSWAILPSFWSDVATGGVSFFKSSSFFIKIGNFFVSRIGFSGRGNVSLSIGQHNLSDSEPLLNCALFM